MNLKEKLKKLKGCKASKNRDFIFEIIYTAKVPLTVEDIQQEFRMRNKPVAISTIYRALEKLAEHNLIQKTVMMDDNKARYESISPDVHKHYFICVECEEMTKLEFCPLDYLKKTVGSEFEITGHKFELYGRCKNCRK